MTSKKSSASDLGQCPPCIAARRLLLPPRAACSAQVAPCQASRPSDTRVGAVSSPGRRGKCRVLYGDESGFCLSPVVPYLWQKKGLTVGLPAQAHSRRLNVLGFLSRQGALHSFETPEKLSAAFVIQSIEALLPTVSRPTVLVLDNASVHRSKLVRAKRHEWKQKGLRLLFLPPSARI